LAITFTWADIGLTIVLGMFGSLLAAFVYSRSQTWLNHALTFWAKRSKNSAQKRVNWIETEIARIEDFQKNPAEFIASVAARIGRVVLYGMVVFLCVSVAVLATTTHSLMHIRLAIDPSYHDTELPFEKPLLYLLFAALVMCSFLLYWEGVQLRSLGSLSERKADLREQLESLNKKLATFEEHQ
jgi:hypothetical protein